MAIYLWSRANVEGTSDDKHSQELNLMSQNVILGMKTELFLTVVFAVKFQSTQQRKCIAILGTYMLN